MMAKFCRTYLEMSGSGSSGRTLARSRAIWANPPRRHLQPASHDGKKLTPRDLSSSDPIHQTQDSLKTIWRSGSHEFNGDTSDGTWGYSQFAVTNVVTSKDGGFVGDGTDGEVTITAGVAVRWTRKHGNDVNDRGSATLFGTVAGSLGGQSAMEWRTSDTGLDLPAWIGMKYLAGQGRSHPPSQPSSHIWAFPRDVWIKLRHGSRSYVCKDLLDLSDDDEQTAVVDKMVDKDYNFDKDLGWDARSDYGQYTGEAHLFFEQIRNMRRTRDGGVLGVSPLEVTGLWTAPICRTLLQVAPLGAEMHWQTQALIDGILTDVLVRLCRAAAEVYAGHALKGKMKVKDEGCSRLLDVESQHANPAYPELPSRQAAEAVCRDVYAGIAFNGDATKFEPQYPQDYKDGRLLPLIREPIDPHDDASDDASSCSAPSLIGSDDSDSNDVVSNPEPPVPDEKNRPDYPTFLTAHHMQAAMWAVFPTDLAEHGMNEIKDALEYNVSMWRVKGTKEPEDPNKIVFHPTLVHAAATEIFTHLKDGKGALRYPEGADTKVKQVDVAVNTLLPYCTKAAKVYMAAVLDYISAELVEAAHQAAQTATYHRKVKAHFDKMEKEGKVDVSEKERKAFEKETWRKEVKEPNYVLPAHLASALRKDKALGTDLAASASLTFAGVSYASLMSLYTPPQPAAKKTIQKKKADAQLDSAWQKELRKRQKEEAKKEAEKRKKEEKEREKERRRLEKIAEKEAKKATDADRERERMIMARPPTKR